MNRRAGVSSAAGSLALANRLHPPSLLGVSELPAATDAAADGPAVDRLRPSFDFEYLTAFELMELTMPIREFEVQVVVAVVHVILGPEKVR